MFFISIPSTLGAETFANFALIPIRESLCTRNFSIFSFSPNWLADLDNALILVSWFKKSRRQCNTKTRSASIAI